MLPSLFVPPLSKARVARFVAIALLLGTSAVSGFAGAASGEESMSALQARMNEIQADLDAATRSIEELRTAKDLAETRVADIQARLDVLRRQTDKLRRVAVKRAVALYRGGGVDIVEVLIGSSDIGEMTDKVQLLSHVSEEDATVFTKLARARAEQQSLGKELFAERDRLSETLKDLTEQSESLQDAFERAADEYERLRRRLAPFAPSATAIAPVRPSGGMVCPVAGPVSFTDTWGAPRSGHTHQGVDMMAGYGTPLVAIVSGTITYAAYDGSGGNMIFLSGDDGNAYWYMHNQQNFVTSGHVTVGQQIATVGDTGNAAGTPHLHFEYHPGGGAPVNPTPLVASLC